MSPGFQLNPGDRHTKDAWLTRGFATAPKGYFRLNDACSGISRPPAKQANLDAGGYLMTMFQTVGLSYIGATFILAVVLKAIV